MKINQFIKLAIRCWLESWRLLFAVTIYFVQADEYIYDQLNYEWHLGSALGEPNYMDTGRRDL